MVIIMDELAEYDTTSLNYIFEILWDNGLIDSQVLTRVTTQCKGTWTLYTFMPYQRDCSTLTELKIASFTPHNYTKDMNVSMAQLFPNKLNDFHQCQMHIAVSTMDPLVVMHNSSDGKVQYKGIEIEIVRQLSKMLNFNITFQRSTDGTNNGVILPNKTVTGNLKLVRRKLPILNHLIHSILCLMK